MKYCALAILAALSASLALAEDFKTINGKEYKDATVTHVEPDGIVVKTKTGISKVYFTELPKEVQERFHYDSAQAAHFSAAPQATASFPSEKQRGDDAGSNYNRLVLLQQAVDQSWAQVQNVYQRRADSIPNLVNTVSGAANFDKSTLVEVTNARTSVGRVQMQLDPNKAPTDAAQLAQFQAAQGQLSNALSRLLLVSERYPELKANQNFLSLQAQLEGTENRISVERGNFNKTVQDYNVAVRSFPTNLIAGMLGFPPKPFFTAQPGAEKPPPVQFNFSSPAPAPAATAAP